MLSDCFNVHQHIPIMAGCQDGARANGIWRHVQYPHAEVTAVDGGSSHVRQVMQDGQPVPAIDTLSFHKRDSRVTCKFSTLVHQIRQIYMLLPAYTIVYHASTQWTGYPARKQLPLSPSCICILCFWSQKRQVSRSCPTTGGCPVDVVEHHYLDIPFQSL
jgi:hypothetical protein